MSNRTKLSLTIMSLTATIMASGLTACGNSKWHEVARNTGDEIAERQVTQTTARDLTPGQTVYTSPNRLIGRQTPEQDPADSDIVLDRNEEIVITDATPRGSEGLVTGITVDTQQEVLVPPQYVSPTPVVAGPEQAAADKYFVVQNIATEKLRVYRNCATLDASGACKHKMILETEMVAGEDTPDQVRRTNLGSYVITEWFKFYEDGAKHFPSWYAPSYPAVPAAGSPIEAWLSPSINPPQNSAAQFRGAFGWYTAKISPNHSEQWTHGTFGWGADGASMILKSREARMDLRSQGCSRVENQAIAFMRDIMPRGSKLIKIYAKEALSDSTLARYQREGDTKWEWTLTKDGVKSTTLKSNRAAAAGKPASEILESGSYTLDQMPTVAATTNLYKIADESFKGVFNIDEGRAVGYSHPTEIRVGGYSDKQLPSLMIGRSAAPAVTPVAAATPAPEVAPAVQN